MNLIEIILSIQFSVIFLVAFILDGPGKPVPKTLPSALLLTFLVFEVLMLHLISSWFPRFPALASNPSHLHQLDRKKRFWQDTIVISLLFALLLFRTWQIWSQNR
jgi:hypothetical protein